MTRFDAIETERLALRRWRDADRAPFAELNGDAETLPGAGGSRGFLLLSTHSALDCPWTGQMIMLRAIVVHPLP